MQLGGFKTVSKVNPFLRAFGNFVIWNHIVTDSPVSPRGYFWLNYETSRGAYDQIFAPLQLHGFGGENLEVHLQGFFKLGTSSFLSAKLGFWRIL